jgi:hypothetical protein
MKIKDPLYYCSECKKIISSVESLLFVENDSPKGFCSESCIEDFYRPIMSHYEQLVKELRTKLALEYEHILSNLDDKQLVEDILSWPSEIWETRNELNEKIFTYIKRYHDFSAVLLGIFYNKDASFILLLEKTKSENLVNELRGKDKVSSTDVLTENGDFSEEDYNFLQQLESKKSKLLADLLLKRKESDIAFEDFSNYEKFFELTLQDPDEVFETKDNEGDIFFNYIKNFSHGNSSFFYIISCLKRVDSETSTEINVFPVLAFPTNDLDLFSGFRSGVRVSGQLKN